MNVVAVATPLFLVGALPFWAQSWFEVLITAVIGAFTYVVVPLLDRNFKDKKWVHYLRQGSLVVSHFWGSRVKRIKQHAADDVITEAEKREQLESVMQDAIIAFKQWNGGEAKVAKGLGVTVEKVDDAVRGILESQVASAKNAGAQARTSGK